MKKINIIFFNDIMYLLHSYLFSIIIVENRLAEMSSMGIGNKPCLDIKPSEDQISDRSISIHQLARGNFMIITLSTNYFIIKKSFYYFSFMIFRSCV